MSNFLFSINVTIPIFLVMVIGYFLRQIGMLNENFVTVANKFNFKVTLPFLLFRDLSTVNIQEVFDLKYVLFCAIATSVCFWSVYGLTKIFMKDRSMTGAFVMPRAALGVAIALARSVVGSSLVVGSMIVMHGTMFLPRPAARGRRRQTSARPWRACRPVLLRLLPRPPRRSREAVGSR